MVGAGVSLTNAILHQTGKRGQHRDRRINTRLVELAVEDDLPLGDIAGQVRNRVGDIVVGHGQDRHLRDRAGTPLHDPGPLIERREVGIEVAGKPLSPGDLPLGGGELAQRLAVGGDVGHDDQHMHPPFEGEVFRNCQRTAGGEDTFDDRVVREVEEHDHLLHDPRLFKRAFEIVGNVVLDPHCSKDDHKAVRIRARKPGLLHDLYRQLVVAHARAGEDRQLLPADQGGKRVDRRDAGVDIVARVFAGNRVERFAVDIRALLAKDLPQPINRAARTVERPAEQFRGKGHLHRMPEQGSAGVVERHAPRPLKNLDHRAPAVDLDDPPEPVFPIVHPERNHLLKGGVRHPFQRNQRPVDLAESCKLKHLKSSLLS